MPINLTDSTQHRTEFPTIQKPDDVDRKMSGISR
jgi:hypothetical protein